MTIPAQPEAAPAEAAPPAGPVPLSVFQRAEAAVERHLPRGPAETAVSDEIRLLLRGHSATLIHAAGDIIAAGWPGAEPVASKVLEVALGVARAAGIVL